MMFLWNEALWLLLSIPVIAGAYVLLLLRRRDSHALRYSSLGVVREANGASQWRRHIPPLLILLGLTALVLAVARPAAIVAVPSEQGTVILAMDVSISMAATDVTPTRLGAG